jgi:transcription elongation factor GreA
MTKDVLLTPDGLAKLKAELVELKTTGRKAVVARIKAAKELGDLSENAEYDDARNEQSFIEGRIQELEAMVLNARVIKHHHSTTVDLGTTVTVSADGQEETYEIVGATESDPSAGKISSESPIGSALLGHKVGDSVNVTTPAGSFAYTVIKIA